MTEPYGLIEAPPTKAEIEQTPEGEWTFADYCKIMGIPQSKVSEGCIGLCKYRLGAQKAPNIDPALKTKCFTTEQEADRYRTGLPAADQKNARLFAIQFPHYHAMAPGKGPPKGTGKPVDFSKWPLELAGSNWLTKHEPKGCKPYWEYATGGIITDPGRDVDVKHVPKPPDLTFGPEGGEQKPYQTLFCVAIISPGKDSPPSKYDK